MKLIMYAFNNTLRGMVLFALLMALSSCGQQSENSLQSTESLAQQTAGSEQVDNRKTLVFFGNSLTAGYGIEPEESYPYLIQDRLDSLAYPYRVVAAGVSGETSATGNSRIDWVLNNKVDIFVLELGGNDGLRGIPPAETKKNLQSIIDKVRAKYPQAVIILAGMQVPPNMGADYANAFKNNFTELAVENNILLIPFLLEGVGGVAELNLPDGIHPNPEGQIIVAENVWEILESALDRSI
jgi:acyl-CoA thioesterase I